MITLSKTSATHHQDYHLICLSFNLPDDLQYDHEGNVVGQAQANGVYEISEKLYLSGYNIGYYDEDIVANNGDGTAYDEASQQVKTCFVKELGIFGHSHGGGSTHDLSKKLDDDRGGIGQFTIPFTGYIDAIDQRFPFINAETRFPPSAGHLLNYYQRDSALDGFSVVGADNHNVTHWGLAFKLPDDLHSSLLVLGFGECKVLG